MRPWEKSQFDSSVRPWQAAQPIYSRSVEVHRPRSVAVQGGAQQIGKLGYSGLEQADDPTTTTVEGEDVLYTGLQASIQMLSPGRTRGVLVPADVVYKPEWRIYIPVSDVDQYDIRDRDIVVDDESYRYGVGAADWETVGYTLACVRLEA